MSLKIPYACYIFAFVQPNINYGLIVWESVTPTALKPIQTNIKNNKGNVI